MGQGIRFQMGIRIRHSASCSRDRISTTCSTLIIRQARLRHNQAKMLTRVGSASRPYLSRCTEIAKKGEVGNRLRTIRWLPRHGGQSVQVTRVNGVDRALEAVSEEIDQLALNIATYAIPVASTYKCRFVAGTNNRSMHAYGAAVDLNVKQSNYWRWQGRLAHPVWQNRIPYEIVKIFEKHGFIWGGRWYHYDTMHFEYRPELIESRAQ